MTKRNSRRRRIKLRAKKRSRASVSIEDIRADFNKELEQLASDPFIPTDIRQAILDTNKEFFD